MNKNIESGDFFSDLLKEQREIEESSGATSENKFFTPEEWFERFYHGQKIEELPKGVLKNASQELIQNLKEKYSFRLPKKNPEVKQTNLFD